MRTITIIEAITLGGIMQAPGGPDDDPRDGFRHGGWARPYMDEVMRRERGTRRHAFRVIRGAAQSASRSGLTGQV